MSASRSVGMILMGWDIIVATVWSLTNFWTFFPCLQSGSGTVRPVQHIQLHWPLRLMSCRKAVCLVVVRLFQPKMIELVPMLVSAQGV